MRPYPFCGFIVTAIGWPQFSLFFKSKILRDQKNGLLVKGLPNTVDVITVGQEFVIDGQEVNISYE